MLGQENPISFVQHFSPLVTHGMFVKRLHLSKSKPMRAMEKTNHPAVCLFIFHKHQSRLLLNKGREVARGQNAETQKQKLSRGISLCSFRTGSRKLTLRRTSFILVRCLLVGQLQPELPPITLPCLSFPALGTEVGAGDDVSHKENLGEPCVSSTLLLLVPA